MSDDSMPPKRTAPEQQLSELIAALTKERDEWADYGKQTVSRHLREIERLNKEIAMWKASYGETCELFHAKCAEIATLTEQRDRAMKALREPSDMLIDKVAVAFCAAGGNLCHYPGCGDICRGETREGAVLALRMVALDAEATAETAPSLPETPEA